MIDRNREFFTNDNVLILNGKCEFIMKNAIVLVFFLLIKIQAGAQLFDRIKEGPPIRNYVLHLGAMQDRPLIDIIDSFRSQKYNEIKMTYAIYTWVAENITFDSRGFRHPGKDISTTTATLKNRTATSEGYANLFKTLCDVAGIKCYTIEGLAKAHPAEITRPDKLPRHYWNMVFIKNYLLFIDVTWAAGSTDAKGKNFYKEFTDAWFFTNKDLFFMSHFTKDKNSPIPPDQLPSKSEFLRAPIVYKAAVAFDIHPSPTIKGKIRGRKGKMKTLDFVLPNEDVLPKIHHVSIVTKYGETPIPIKRYENILVVDIPFEEAGEYAVILKVNGVNAYGFIASVSDNKR